MKRCIVLRVPAEPKGPDIIRPNPEVVRRLRFIAAIAFAAATPLAAQRVQPPAKTIAFPAYTVEQNWTRATTLMFAGQVGGFAVAKARGTTAEEYGRASAEAFAPGWGVAESGSAIRYARAIQNNIRAMNGGVVEVLSANDTLVVMRASRPYVSYFGSSRQSYGVTLDEYDAIGKAFNEGIGRHLGVHYSQSIDNAWITMTISGRGKNAVLDFPSVTYNTSLSAQETGSNTQFLGSWEANYAPGGKYTLQHDGQLFIQSDYAVTLDEVVFTNERTSTGAVGCPGAGRYRWTVNAANGNLSLGRLSDDCTNRVFFLTRKAFTRK